VVGQSAHINYLSKNVVKIEAKNSTGSGIVFSDGEDLFVLTNRHIVEGNYEFIIYALSNINESAKPMFNASLLAFSPGFDFAILEIDTDLNGRPIAAEAYLCSIKKRGLCFQNINLAPSENRLTRGQDIGILGFPAIGYDELIYTSGSISSIKYEEHNQKRSLVWVRTNADMAPGNSGGLAFDTEGNVIGIPTSVFTEPVTGGRLGNILSLDIINNAVESGSLLTDWSSYTSALTALDYSLDPEYGTSTLSTGFAPRIHEVEITAGGSNNVSKLGSDCIGYTAERPDYRLDWSGAAEDLFVMFFPEDEEKDATLVINAPDGSWYCNDDATDDTLNPGVIFINPQEGQYDIWAGSYTVDEYIPGLLTFIEDIESPISPNWKLEPRFGSKTLSPGFLPDPHRKELISGGDINVSDLNLGTSCSGFIAEKPDYRIHLTEDSSFLSVFFSSKVSTNDATILINTPTGDWLCNDDAHSETLNPQIKVYSASEGQYDIWIGSYYDGEFIEGILSISEINENVY
jgi:serine protease Do